MEFMVDSSGFYIDGQQTSEVEFRYALERCGTRLISKTRKGKPMTVVTFFNRHDPDEVWTKEALDSNVGKTLPLTNTITGETGEAKIVAVGVDDEGITVTYETDMNFAMRMDHFSVETPQFEEVTEPEELTVPKPLYKNVFDSEPENYNGPYDKEE